MLATIKEIILDNQEIIYKETFPRELEITSIEGKATICIGVRRCGKSTYIEQLIQKLLKKGVNKENILYLNLFDDRLHYLQHKENNILEAYFSIYPEKKGNEKIYCFFDEIQVLPNWELFINRLLRTEICEVYLTGSSAQMLSKEISTQMRGRALSWEMFPFSFQEFLNTRKIQNLNKLTTRQRLLIQKCFDEYWEIGGFPEVNNVTEKLRVSIHQEYFNTLLFRDLIERYNESHPKAIIDLAHWLVDNISSLYSINKLTNYLQSVGHKINKATVTNYLNWFEDAYFLFTVRLYDASISRSNVNPKKIYCIDHAMVRSVSSGILLNSGHILENLIFVALRIKTNKIYYYRTKNGNEVDFVAILSNQSKLLIQVCESLTNEQTRKRELTAMLEAMQELKLTHGLIITKTEEGVENVIQGQIKIISTWRFLLEF